MSLEAPSRSAARWAAALFVLVVAGLWFHEARPQLQTRSFPWPGHADAFTLPTWLPGDCPYYRASIRSLLRDRDLDLRNDLATDVVPAAGQVALGARGEWYPKHPIGLSLAALPFYAAFGDQGLLLFNLLQLGALAVLVFALAHRYAGEALSFGVALAYAFGTLLRGAAYNFSPDVFSTLLVTAAVLALLQKRAGVGGLLFGLAVVAKWTNLAFLPVAGIWVLLSMGLRPALRFSLLAAPALLGLAALNWRMFGSPLITPYDHVLMYQGTKVAIEPSHREAFDQPFFATLWLQIVRPEKGLVSSAPWVLLAPLGLVPLFFRLRAEAALLVALCLTQLAVFAPYRYWGASSYGHRFLLTVVALSAAPVAALLSAALERRRPGD